MRRLIGMAATGLLMTCGCGGGQETPQSAAPSPTPAAAPPSPVEDRSSGADQPGTSEPAGSARVAPPSGESQSPTDQAHVAQPARAEMPEVDLGQSSYAQSTLLKVADSVPQLELTDLQGNPTTVSPPSDQGELLVLVFWDSTNLFSTLQLRYLQRDVAAKLKGVQVIAVNRGESADVVAAIVDKEKLTLPVLLDTDASAFAHFATETVPRTYLVGNGGKILWLAVTFQGRTTMNTLHQAIEASRAD